jgi:para-nitrobenzyl esterase
MIDYGAGFAGTADPNGPSSPHWSRQTVLSLAPDHIVSTRTAQSRHHCTLWNALG